MSEQSDETQTEATGAPEGWPGPQITDLDEIGGMGEAPSGPSLLDQELQGDTIPEEFRGKKLSDVLTTVSGFKNALKLSEEARQQAMQIAQLAAERRAEPQPPPRPTPPPAPLERTPEQWKELYEQDPFRYNEERFAALERRMTAGVEARVAPVASSAASAAEQQARSKYKEDFDVIGKEIDDFVRVQLGNDQTQLSVPGAWDRIVSYVRGENIDKIISHREAKKAAAEAASRQEAERRAAPPVFSGSRPNGPATPRGGKMTPATMDEVTKEIARNLMPGVLPQKAYEEYCKHYI